MNFADFFLSLSPKNMGRILAIDYGRKRIGLAVTDTLQLIASPMATVTTEEFEIFLEKYINTEPVDEFVIGYPVQMNNQPSESVKYIDPFIRKLKKEFPGKPVHLVDERFTSLIASRAIVDGGLKKIRRRDKTLVDKISASLILQSYLDNRSFKMEKH
jgi:putative Holliday junction resolvase